jgi:hypothetical protein
LKIQESAKIEEKEIDLKIEQLESLLRRAYMAGLVNKAELLKSARKFLDRLLEACQD